MGLRILLKMRTQSGSVDLSALENLSAEQASFIAKTSLNVCLQSSCLDAEAINILTRFTGELHLIGNGQVDQLEIMKDLKCALFFELDNELDEESAKLLAEFHAKMIGIRCRNISKQALSHLVNYTGSLTLGGPGRQWYCDFEIDIDLAKILIERKAPLKVEEGWRISADVMKTLVLNDNLELSSYRRTFDKSEKKGKSTLILEKLYDQNTHKEHLLRSTLRDPSGFIKVTNENRTSQYNNQGFSYLEAATSKLLQTGWQEVMTT